MKSLDLQSAIMGAIIEASLTKIDGATVAKLDAAAIVDAFSIITASLLASSPEAQTSEGMRRLLRRQARQLERRIVQFNAHTRVHGSPFKVAA